MPQRRAEQQQQPRRGRAAGADVTPDVAEAGAAAGPLRERDQAEAGGLTLLRLLEASPGMRTWLAAGEESPPQVVRRFAGLPEADRESRLRTLSQAATLRHPALLPPSRAWAAGGALWVARPHGDGVSLRRLMAETHLSTRQVAAIGADTLAGITTLHAAGLVHGDLHPGNVLVGRDGRARVTDIGLPRPFEGRAATSVGSGVGGSRFPARAADVAAVAQLIRTALSAPAGDDPDAGQPVDGRRLLDITSPGGLFAGTAQAARAALLAAAGEPGPQTHRQIAALVASLRIDRADLRGRRAGEPASGASPSQAADRAGGASGGVGLAVAPRQRPPREMPSPLPGGWSRMPAPLRRRAPRVRRSALVVLLVAVAVVGAVVLIARSGGPGPATSRQPHVGPTPGSSTSASGSTSPGASAGAATTSQPGPPAPAAAGDVTGVSVSPTTPGGCTAAAGATCTLRVEVDLAPNAAQTVSWELTTVDACTGAAATVPGSSVPAGADYRYVFGDSQISFASGHPVTLYAVTSAPARAASPGLSVPGSNPC